MNMKKSKNNNMKRMVIELLYTFVLNLKPKVVLITTEFPNRGDKFHKDQKYHLKSIKNPIIPIGIL
jgi:hypothetical protein